MNEVSDSFTLNINGKPREVFMSFGLLRTLSNLTGNNVENAPLLQFNDEMNTQALCELLSVRNSSGRVMEPLSEEDLNELNVEINDMVDIVDWAIQHVLNFFIRKSQKLGATMKKVQPIFEKMEAEQEQALSSVDGSKT